MEQDPVGPRHKRPVIHNQLQAPEILCRLTVWDYGASLQPEPQADGGTRKTVPVPKIPHTIGPQQLKAGGSHVTSDEDTGDWS